MIQTAKIFAHGRSQAVRLPKGYRFTGSEVRITRVGDKVILEPLGIVAPLPWAEIDACGAEPLFPEGREQPVVPPERPALFT